MRVSMACLLEVETLSFKTHTHTHTHTHAHTHNKLNIFLKVGIKI